MKASLLFARNNNNNNCVHCKYKESLLMSDILDKLINICMALKNSKVNGITNENLAFRLQKHPRCL